MELDEQTRTRAHELCELDSSHPQPWLLQLLQARGVEDALASRAEALLGGRIGLPRVHPVSMYKPDGRVRAYVLLPLDVEVAMIRASFELVRGIEAARRPVSLANVADLTAEHHWCLLPFRKQRQRRKDGEEGAYRRYKRLASAIRRDAAAYAVADVANFFPDLAWKVVLDQVAAVAGCDKHEAQAALRTLVLVRRGLQGIQHGLPVGPDLSRVVGTALLSLADDFLVAASGEEGAVRWVDDFCFRADSVEAARKTLRQLQAGPLALLGVSWSGAKTGAYPGGGAGREGTLASSTFDDEVDLDNVNPDPAALETLQQASAEGRQLTRNEVRAAVSAMQWLGLSDDEEAGRLADGMGSMLIDHATVTRRIRRLGGGADLGEIVDRAITSVAERSTENGPTAYAAAEFLLDLDKHKLAPAEEPSLRMIRDDSRQHERARGVRMGPRSQVRGLRQAALGALTRNDAVRRSRHLRECPAMRWQAAAVPPQRGGTGSRLGAWDGDPRGVRLRRPLASRRVTATRPDHRAGEELVMGPDEFLAEHPDPRPWAVEADSAGEALLEPDTLFLGHGQHALEVATVRAHCGAAGTVGVLTPW